MNDGQTSLLEYAPRSGTYKVYGFWDWKTGLVTVIETNHNS